MGSKPASYKDPFLLIDLMIATIVVAWIDVFVRPLTPAGYLVLLSYYVPGRLGISGHIDPKRDQFFLFHGFASLVSGCQFVIS